MKLKHLPISIKLTLDLLMALLFIIALGFRSTGGLAHELIGLAFCGFCTLHVVINWNWYRHLQKGGYTFRRILNTVLNLALPVGVIVLCISGIMNSNHVFGYLKLKGSMDIRQMHSVVAYWGIILLGIHAGVQWAKVLAALKNKAGARHRWLYNNLLLRCMATLAVAYGIWAAFDRAMGSKLFLGFSFDFWDSSRPEILFYTHNVAIMALYVAITHYVLKVFTMISGVEESRNAAAETL